MKLQIHPERFDEFFAPLVGSEDAVADLETNLAEYVHDPRWEARVPDPYQRLENGLLEAAKRGVDQGYRQGDRSVWNGREWSSIEVNGDLGIKLAVAGLRMVGNIYAHKARVPQREEVVGTSTMRALRFIYGIAFSDASAGAVTLGALRLGVNPHNRLMRPLSFLTIAKATATGKHRIHPRVFEVDKDDDDQLHVSPKFKKLQGVPGRGCPAAHAMVDGAEHRRSALLTFMQVAGSIALNDIYPEQFDMVQGS